MPFDQYTAVTDAELEAARQQLFNGLVDDSALETMLKVGPQAINRYINDEGLPFIKLGRKRYFDITAVNVWLRSRPQQNAPARGPGRPRERPRQERAGVSRGGGKPRKYDTERHAAGADTKKAARRSRPQSDSRTNGFPLITISKTSGRRGSAFMSG
jgi:hypothetical protein